MDVEVVYVDHITSECWQEHLGHHCLQMTCSYLSWIIFVVPRLESEREALWSAEQDVKGTQENLPKTTLPQSPWLSRRRSAMDWISCCEQNFLSMLWFFLFKVLQRNDLRYSDTEWFESNVIFAWARPSQTFWLCIFLMSQPLSCKEVLFFEYLLDTVN